MRFAILLEANIPGEGLQQAVAKKIGARPEITFDRLGVTVHGVACLVERLGGNHPFFRDLAKGETVATKVRRRWSCAGLLGMMPGFSTNEG
jgi:hypothetical protein